MPTVTPGTIPVLRPASCFAGKKIEFIGIGGCGISGLALMLQSLGAACSGSDIAESATTTLLAGSGIDVHFNQADTPVPLDCDLVIASAAIPQDLFPIDDARRRGIRIMRYAEALGRLQEEQTGVSLAGTHGKSTTTAMLCHALVACGSDPGFIIGASCDQIGGGHRIGSPIVPGTGPYAGRPGFLIAEACEYDRSFLQHQPVVGLIHNIEEDHLDVYTCLEDIVAAFADFAALLPSREDGGLLLVAHDGAHRREVTAPTAAEIETYGFSPAADTQVAWTPGENRVVLRRRNQDVATWINPMPGEHNVMNAAAAAVLAHRLGGSWGTIASALEGFRGLDRRMQFLGTRSLRGGGVKVYDDYGHHPTEIEKTLQALRECESPRRLICVFQPHQHSRTRFLLDEFTRSFKHADIVMVPPIYFVRDSTIEKTRINSTDLVRRLTRQGTNALALDSFRAIEEALEDTVEAGDLLVIMGAGPVGEIAAAFLAAGESQT